jgi:formamidopyrimidine-DNA glycosylase
MPETPEITSRAVKMNRELVCKTITSVDILQPKCLNLSAEEFTRSIVGTKIESVSNHGKWIKVQTTLGWVLINLGMGGELLLTNREKMPAKYRLVLDFDDKTCLAVNFWWFGYVHFCPLEALSTHPMISKLGPNILDLSEVEFFELIKPQKGRVKAFLIDQSKVAGIGNAYIHDILFLAHLHPLRMIASLKEDEIHRLYTAIQEGLRPSLAKGGAFYELDLYGQKGGFQMEDILIGYRENSPCPQCGTPIVKIKTGSTSSFICPSCQPES